MIKIIDTLMVKLYNSLVSGKFIGEANVLARLSSSRQKEIDDVVSDVLSRAGKNYPNDTLLDIIHAYDPNIQVSDFDFGNDSELIKGAIKYPNATGPAILLNQKRVSRGERAFTLGHEFGHYLLHGGAEKFRLELFNYGANTEESLQETEANYFAASLLMPRSEMHQMLKLTDNHTLIARYFGVTESALRTRIKWMNDNPLPQIK